MSGDEACDYCHDTTSGDAFYLRAVGFTEWEGRTAPLVKVHCGECLTDDDIDPAAAVALRDAVRSQTQGAKP